MSHLLVQSDARRIPLADGSVHCVVTSPPYFGLRDYGTGRWEGGDAACDHKASNWDRGRAIEGRTINETKDRTTPYRDACGQCGARRVDRQLGLEQSPDAFVTAMVAVFREVRRVLHPSGTAWVNIGDSYANDTKWGGSGGGETSKNYTSGRGGCAGQKAKRCTGLKPKDLMGIPWLLAFALRADGWWLRSEIIWHKSNPMPESVTDRPTKSHEQVFVLSKRESYFYDAEAVREKAEYGRREGTNWKRPRESDPRDKRREETSTVYGSDPESGRNLRSVWTIPSESYPGSHYATFPRKLVEPCIKAGTSERGCCPACKAPWVREIERGEQIEAGHSHGKNAKHVPMRAVNGEVVRRWMTSTLDWAPSCHCPDHTPEPCTILDPFCGSGTSIVVALALGRRAIGLDLSREYLTRDAQRRLNRPHARPIRPEREESMPLFEGLT